MILQISELTYQILVDFSAANGSPFGGDIYPLVAPLKAKDPFCVYRISKRPMLSKDGVYDVDVDIVVGGHNHDQLAAIVDALETYFDSGDSPECDYHYIGTDSGTEPDNPEQINFTIKYNLKMIK